MSMFSKKIISLLLLAAIMISGCSNASGKIETAAPSAAPTAELSASASPAAEPSPSAEVSEQPVVTDEPEAEKYVFNPHLYVPMLADDVPSEYWESFYRLCDALRVGQTTFECASEEAYKWATDPAVLNALFPAACMKVKGVSNDGSAPFENGVGRIYYQMPIDEFVERQAQFEALIVDILNGHLEPDDNEFEKSLKIFDYISVNYSYEQEFVANKPDGANYIAINDCIGQCIDIGGAYAYLLLQAGVEAVLLDCSVPTMAHAWTYLVIDGKGYHSDATWSLRETAGGGELGLYYFLMTGERRADSGCPVDDLASPLLPKYWAKFSSAEFVAKDDEYCFPAESFLTSLDEAKKIVYYKCGSMKLVLKYA